MATSRMQRIKPTCLQANDQRGKQEVDAAGCGWCCWVAGVKMAGVSLKFRDCGAQLKSVEEAQEYAELTKHTNYSESTEAVLNLVSSTCGKPCSPKLRVICILRGLDILNLRTRLRKHQSNPYTLFRYELPTSNFPQIMKLKHR